MRIPDLFASSQEQCLIHIFFDSDPKGVSVAVAIPSVSGVWFLDWNHRPPPCQDVSTGSLIQSEVLLTNIKYR